MPAPRHLRAAPIREAVIDFQVKASQGFDPRVLDQLKPLLAPRFPHAQERRGGKVTFQLAPAGAQPPTIEDLGLQGMLLKSADDKLVVLARTDGLALSRLKPYTSWEELFPLALEVWEAYRSIAKPEIVTRAGLRFINDVELPPDMHDFEEYMRAAPHIPPEIPQVVSAFLTRTTILDDRPDRQVAANVLQALQTDQVARRVTLLLDIDAFRESSWEPNDPDLATTFGYLRDFKNLIFFNVLTDETLRRFE